MCSHAEAFGFRTDVDTNNNVMCLCVHVGLGEPWGRWDKD